MNNISYSNQTYSPSFCGVNKVLNRRLYSSAQEIQEQISKYPKSNWIVGHLPSEWMNNIPQVNRGEIIKTFYNRLNQIIKEFKKSDDVDKLVDSINKAMFDSKITKNNDFYKFQEMKEGKYKKSYHFSDTNNNSIILQIFKYPGIQNDKFADTLHGPFVEMNRAAFIQKNAGTKTQFAKNYFGDVDAGYMMNFYVGDLTPVCNKKVPLEVYGLLDVDLNSARNTIRGYKVDYGDLAIKPPLECLAKNKTARYAYKKIFVTSKEKRAEKIKEILKTDKFKNNDNIKLGIAHSIRLLEKDSDIEEVFDLIGNSTQNKEVLLALTNYLDSIKKIPESFDNIIKFSDTETKKTIVKKIIFFSKDEKIKGLKALLAQGDEEVRKMIQEMPPSIRGDIAV